MDFDQINDRIRASNFRETLWLFPVLGFSILFHAGAGAVFWANDSQL